jgi:filamin
MYACRVSGCGTGVVDVGIVDPQGAKNTVRAVITKKTDDMWYVEYTALVAGAHSVNIFFAGKAAAKSPYIVGVGQGLFINFNHKYIM